MNEHCLSGTIAGVKSGTGAWALGLLVALRVCAAAPAQQGLTCEFGQFRWCWAHAYGSVRKPEFSKFILASRPTHVCIHPWPSLADRKEHDRLLDIVKKDNEFLLRGDVFTEDLFEGYIAYKKQFEYDEVRIRPHPHEFTLYYGI